MPAFLSSSSLHAPPTFSLSLSRYLSLKPACYMFLQLISKTARVSATIVIAHQLFKLSEPSGINAPGAKKQQSSSMCREVGVSWGLELGSPLNQRDKHVWTLSWSFLQAVWQWMFWRTALLLTPQSLEMSQCFVDTDRKRKALHLCFSKPAARRSHLGSFTKLFECSGLMPLAWDKTWALLFLKATKLKYHYLKCTTFTFTPYINEGKRNSSSSELKT